MLSTMIRTRPGRQFVQFMRGNTGKKIDKFLVRTTGFSLLMKTFSAMVGFPPMPVLMIYTIGRKSGEERSTVMPYVEMDGTVYLIGSNGAKPRDPLWMENLRANPRARLIIDRQTSMRSARFVEHGTDEYARLWAFAETKTPQYTTYQNSTTRRIPVVAMEPA
ncbi:nitroreductase family deazaflavin-dependent oxidoreductase [Rhizorhabdus dicambivorans]|uniref:Nitroreductase family deazaflavin-dependent oxidoreductase n=1 Tax=Rhizorhabdus dicambivorans TaxID=1850238 RepID=A0A2A4FWW1_9SPHN|nr:nitroreductase family deazaflavin-dependent oxidoreductase [Rhizorhabdus dicambivorans]ATE65825.1 nitroreductase family deazaflavin-dependent oxidoreductase [Rhizorhabdus dicambivorans]PCE42939.1 nitroreductase family deazaflavin-dependent oxidoreductase [Rhizorhabdus dicambivorans]